MTKCHILIKTNFPRNCPTLGAAQKLSHIWGKIGQFLGKFWAKNIDAYRFVEISPAGAIPGQNIVLGKIFCPQNNDTYGPWNKKNWGHF
jgi:hypothetical protein